ncbi:type VI secretion system-associated protein TagF [uncultured Agrobacterium sp.]|uniref:type VI secretion system-associated protein TagF n=1 Tax=uncultured Agrobacterium sp. TaxID=157277 RepID=UPI0025867B8D|nr:type VI secretion system-associated protein TagF [uncultured Agrobacterium sp.]
MAKQVQKLVDPVAESDRIGFFGKIPSHGDFISEGLDRELVGTLDEWLRAGLHACADQFAGRWSSVFSSSPPRRFIIERGVWGNAAYTGVLLPSKDRVGRKYPLVVLAQLNSFRQHPKMLYLDETWFMAAEALAETSMAGDFEMSRFTSAIRRLRLPKPKEEEDSYPPEPRMGKPTSLWWHIDAETRRPKGFKFEGKPNTGDFVKLFQEAQPTPEPAPAQQAEQPPRTNHAPAAAPVKQATASAAPRQVQQTSVVYSYATHAGTKLASNADSLFVSKNPAIFAIADGIGDGQAAVEAARLTTNMLADIAAAGEDEIDPQTIRAKLGTVNSLLLSRQSGEGILRHAASVVSASISSQALTILWSGDARAYLLKDGTMHPLTRDHVIVGMKRQLSQCVGHSQQFRPDVIRDEWGSSDRLLLCSFPLVHQLKERVVAEILSESPVRDCANALIQEALIEDVRENISAIVIGNEIVSR